MANISSSHESQWSRFKKTKPDYFEDYRRTHSECPKIANIKKRKIA